MSKKDNPTQSLPDDTGDTAFRTSTLRTVAVLLASVSTLLIPLVYANTSNPLETWTTVLFAVVSWISLLLIRRGYTRYNAHIMVSLVLLVACFGVVAIGSVRGAVAFLYVGAVVGAGIFLNRNALIATVAFSATALAVLTVAELHGYLPQHNLEVGLKTWLTQTATLVVVAIMVYFSRHRAKQALQLQMNELLRRQELEAERDQHLERFARFFRSSPSPMLAQSAHTGYLVDVNPAFERAYGYTKEQVVGKEEGFLWADPSARPAYLRRLFTERLVTQYPVLGLRADGSTFSALISSEMGKDPKDKLIITTVSDISEQSAALAQLRRSEERFAKTFHFSPLNMTITRYEDGSLVEIQRVDHRPRDDRPEHEPTVAREFWPDQQSRGDFVRALRRESRLHGYETRLRKPDGTLIEVRIWAELIDMEGEPCVLACTMNVTEEKRREALLLEMAQGMSAQTGEAFFAVLVEHMAKALGADTVFVREATGAGQAQTLAIWRHGQLAAADAVPAGPWLESPPDNTIAVFEHSQPGALAVGSETYPNHATQNLLDHQGQTIGTLTALWKSPTPFQPENRALFAIFAGRASAELQRHQHQHEIQRLNSTLEQRVRLRTAELEQVNAELDSFAYSVSHDLKSPLRAIDGFTQLLKDQLQDRASADERAMMERVLAATHRMSDLIADMLSLARISQRMLEMDEVDLSDLVQDIRRRTQTRMPERAIEWRIQPDLLCRCDASLARIALDNLLSNALKYTRDQPHPLIEFGQMPGTSGGPGEYFVRDNGVGFDMRHADKLFKPFQRLHMPSEGFEGSGIGLATVHRIVERHAGRIRADSRVGEGTSLYFSFEANQP